MPDPVARRRHLPVAQRRSLPVGRRHSLPGNWRRSLPVGRRHSLPGTWPLWLVLLAGLLIRLALIGTSGSGYDIGAFQEWTRQMLAHPLSEFYAAALFVPQDHLPGDLWGLYALGRLWELFGGGEFAGDGAAETVLKLVPIALDLALGVIAAAIVRPFAGDRAARLTLLAIVFNPAIIFISAIWGQWNVLATTLVALAVLLIVRRERDGVLLALPVLAFAALVKPQFLALLLPIAVLLARRSREGVPLARLVINVAVGGLASVLLMLAAILPFDVGFPGMGTRWSLVERVQFAADRYTTVTKGAYNLWTLFFPDDGAEDSGTLLGVTYQHIGFALLVATCLYAVVVGWRLADARVGMLAGMALIATATFMVVTRSHERYLIDGMVLTIIAAAMIPRLRPAAWVLSAGLLLNVWFVWGYWHRAWVADIAYTDALYRLLASVNVIGFALMVLGASPKGSVARHPHARKVGQRSHGKRSCDLT
jgi:hypothetical protein